MNAKNLKCVFLTGTPMINNLFEISKLFNMLRGYIVTYNFILRQTGKTASNALYKRVNTLLNSHPLVDQYIINKKCPNSLSTS